MTKLKQKPIDTDYNNWHKKISQKGSADSILGYVRSKQLYNTQGKPNYKGEKLSLDLFDKWLKLRGIDYNKLSLICDYYNRHITVEQNQLAKIDYSEHKSLLNAKKLVSTLRNKILEILINVKKGDKIKDHFSNSNFFSDTFSDLHYNDDDKIADLKDDDLRWLIEDELFTVVEKFYNLPHKNFYSFLVTASINHDYKQIIKLLSYFDYGYLDYLKEQKEKQKAVEQLRKQNPEKYKSDLRALLKLSTSDQEQQKEK